MKNTIYKKVASCTIKRLAPRRWGLTVFFLQLDERKWSVLKVLKHIRGTHTGCGRRASKQSPPLLSMNQPTPAASDARRRASTPHPARRYAAVLFPGGAARWKCFLFCFSSGYLWQPRSTAPHPVGVDARHFTRVHTAPQRCAAARTRCVFPFIYTVTLYPTGEDRKLWYHGTGSNVGGGMERVRVQEC